MPEPILQIRGLDAHYGDFQALYGIDMEVCKGEVLAIIGANGAGKTTLMRSITGLLSNGPGQIRYHGEDISGLRADQVAARGLAMVPEGRQLFASLTAESSEHDRARPSALVRSIDKRPTASEMPLAGCTFVFDAPRGDGPRKHDPGRGSADASGLRGLSPDSCPYRSSLGMACGWVRTRNRSAPGDRRDAAPMANGISDPLRE
ncbi:ATP-binding cassette domain-containing protein [Microbulbifer sp. S227A]|uniref:ATP-binding cassette domain-containing protein n=1 Tax=Microbulbifer sp. S227A TaxID=3415131 RepID=UPI003C7C38A7